MHPNVSYFSRSQSVQTGFKATLRRERGCLVRRVGLSSRYTLRRVRVWLVRHDMNDIQALALLPSLNTLPPVFDCLPSTDQKLEVACDSQQLTGRMTGAEFVKLLSTTKHTCPPCYTLSSTTLQNLTSTVRAST